MKSGGQSWLLSAGLLPLRSALCLERMASRYFLLYQKKSFWRNWKMRRVVVNY